ncbi:MAG: 16S rRNA (cytosine(967)-C(5))-methyltransferase RsmB [Cytophagales bacterium]|nr:16S rRNA (cytosine(967)-C(5))-methyltransferase RsmB [Cytophagales bacterium]
MLALSSQLGATAKAVAFVMAGRSLNDVLLDGSVVKPDMRAGVQALSFAVLRNWGMARALRELLAPREPMPPVDALLCTALALLVSEPDSGASYTDFTLVNQAVDAAKAHSKTRTSASFINAILRRFLREREALTQQAARSEEAQYNHPQWWIDQLRREQPGNWQAILAANQMKPPLTLRVNLAKTTVVEFTELLALQGVATLGTEMAPLQPLLDKACGLVLRDTPAVQGLPHYADGWFSVQDIAAQGAAAQLLNDEFLARLVGRAKQGHKIRVLDACAAPGGKTTHLIERLLCAFADAGMPVLSGEDWGKHFEVVALELDAKRARRVHENLSRLKQRAVVKIADAAQVANWWDGVPFDAILLDAPCTASGIVRRHPDVRWLRRESDAGAMGHIQLAMLQSLWTTLAAQGRLLYATCSVFQLEGEVIKRQFLQIERQAKALDSHGLWLPSLLHDGFYDALFEKTTA